MSLLVNLLPYSTSIQLSKDLIRTHLPESLIGQALESEPEITHLDLTQPVATPEALQVVSEYLQGREPTKSNITLAAAAKYLNLPWLAYYADPFYDRLEKPVTNTQANRKHLSQAVEDENTLMVNYLLQKGVTPKAEDLNTAAELNSVPIVALLLPSPHVNPSSALEAALPEESVASAKLLLADPRTKVYDQGLADAVSTRDTDLVKKMLAREDTNVNGGHPSPIEEALDTGNVEMAQVLISDPSFDPDDDDAEGIKRAVFWNRPEILKLLLAHPKSDPSNITGRMDDFHTYVYEHRNEDAAQVLLADPRYAQGNEFYAMVNDNPPQLTPTIPSYQGI
jgi:hypothetical protein